MWQGIFSKGLSSVQSLCQLSLLSIVYSFENLLSEEICLITSKCWLVDESSGGHILILASCRIEKKNEFKEVLGQLFSTESYIVPILVPNSSNLEGLLAISENILDFHDWGWGERWWHLEGSGHRPLQTKQPAVLRTDPRWRIIQAVSSIVGN